MFAPVGRRGAASVGHRPPSRARFLTWGCSVSRRVLTAGAVALVGAVPPKLDLADVIGPIPHAADAPGDMVPDIQFDGPRLREKCQHDQDDGDIETHAERIPKA